MKEHSAVSAPPKSPASDCERKTKVLLVDDEDRFRRDLADRLRLRGLEVEDVAEGEEAVRIARIRRPDVVILDRKMPGMQGEEVLLQIKRVAPEVQVVMLTGHASIESAKETGRLDAFAYLQKPCETEILMETIESARQEKKHAMARHEMVHVESRTVWGWLWGAHNFRPGVLMLATFSAMTACRACVNDIVAANTGIALRLNRPSK